MSNRIDALDQLFVVFEELFNSRDVDGLMGIFTPDAVFVPQPGAEPLTGQDNIRAAFEGLLAFNLPISARARKVYTAGHVGLALGEWSIEGTGPDGSQVSLEGTPSDVAVYDETHGWRVAVDNPFGTAAL